MIEHLLRKMSDWLLLPLLERNNILKLYCGNITLTFDGKTLTLESSNGVCKIDKNDIKDAQVFENHCKITLSKGVIRIIKIKENKFKFFVEIKSS